MTFSNFISNVMDLNDRSNVIFDVDYHYGCNGHAFTVCYREDTREVKTLVMCEKITPERLDKTWRIIENLATQDKIQILEKKIDELEAILKLNNIQY